MKEKEWNIKNESIPLESELSTSKKELEKAQRALAELQNFKANFKTNQEKLETQVEELTKEQSDYKLAQENVLYNLDKNKNEMSDLTYDIQVAQKQMLTLEAQKNAYEEMNLGRAIDSILKAKIKGVHAPLLQLGNVDKQYATALEVAMGARMKNIVVDDEDVARICIDYLKSARAGTATFLPLNKMKPTPSSLKLPKEKGVIDYAINLLDFDDIYLDAFFYALGDTVVVEDYDCAKRLIGKFRIVTLDGSLFEKSGAITGGDRRDTGLKFSQNQDEELTKYKKRFADLQAKYAQLEETRKDLEQRHDKIRRNYSETMTALNGAKFELNNLNKMKEQNEASIAECERVIKENEPKIKNIENKLEKTEEQLVSINDKMLVLQDKIAEVEAKMSEGELKKLKEMTANIEEKIKEYKNDITNANNSI